MHLIIVLLHHTIIHANLLFDYFDPFFCCKFWYLLFWTFFFANLQVTPNHFLQNMLIAASENLLYIKRAMFFEKEIFGHRRQREIEKEKQGETKYSSGEEEKTGEGKGGKYFGE